MLYQELHKRFYELSTKKDLLNKKVIIKTKILTSEEAIGNPDRKDFPLLKGKEVLMSAQFMDSVGQAYTQAPSEFEGMLEDIFKLSLDDIRNRGLFIASLNAVMRYLYPDLTTIHCKDNEPEECATEIANFLEKLSPKKIGLIGLQPAMLDALSKKFGPSTIRCLDRDEDNIGKEKFGVKIEFGDDKTTEDLFLTSDLVLATGSSVVNGSLVDILNLAQKTNTPLYLYGTTIAGAAKLLGLNRLCFRSK